MKTGGWFANILKKDLERLLRLVSNDSSWAVINTSSSSSSSSVSSGDSVTDGGQQVNSQQMDGSSRFVVRIGAVQGQWRSSLTMRLTSHDAWFNNRCPRQPVRPRACPSGSICCINIIISHTVIVVSCRRPPATRPV